MSLPASLTLKRPVCYPLIFAVSLTYSQAFALDAKLPEPTTKHLYSKSMLPQAPKIDMQPSFNSENPFQLSGTCRYCDNWYNSWDCIPTPPCSCEYGLKLRMQANSNGYYTCSTASASFLFLWKYCRRFYLLSPSFWAVRMKQLHSCYDTAMRNWKWTKKQTLCCLLREALYMRTTKHLTLSNWHWYILTISPRVREFSMTSTPNCMISPELISCGELSSEALLRRWLLTNVPLLLFVSCR